jgi:sortase B
LTSILLLISYAGYALWDSKQIRLAADKSQYAIYKPTIANEGKSFLELQAINDEVFAWLTVYGTNIDYPVTQGPDNMKYVNTNAEGLYSLVGSIFLDHKNNKDFSDFNNILYGHHMERKTMFGEIGEFAHQDMFDSHPYGNLYFNGQNHGIEFFAFIHADAYDRTVFMPKVRDDDHQDFLDSLLAHATFQKDIGVTVDDHIIMLSTCSASSTNGRDILVGRISDKVFEDTFLDSPTNEGKIQLGVDSHSGLLADIPAQLQMLILIIAIVIVLILMIILIRKQRTKS